MSDSTTRPTVRGRLLLVSTAIFAVAALALVATPAGADPTPFTAENFSPDTSGGGPASAGTSLDTETSVMSDLNDGGNSTFHATTVASVSTTLVQYYLCPVAFPDSEVDPASDPVAEDPTQGVNGCSAVSPADTTPVTPSGVDVGEAYEAEIDLPSDGTFDLVAWVCGGSTTTNDDCDAEVEPSVAVDDVSSGGTSSSSGEIISPLHGSNPSNEGFTASARTSVDVTAVTFCLAALDGTPPVPANTPADESGDPTQCITDPDNDGTAGTPAIKTDTSPNQTESTFKTWSVAFSEAETPNNLEMALVLFEGTATDGDGPVPPAPAESGTGLCATGDVDCQLDSHYVVTTPQTATSARIAFPDEGPEGSLPNDCGEAAATSTSEAETEQYSRVQGCILDQSGNNVTDARQWAFQITPIDAAATETDETGFECFNPGPGKTCRDTNFPAAEPDAGEHQEAVGPFGWPNYECTDRDPGPEVTPGTGCPSGPVGADGVQNDFNGDGFYEQADGEPATTGEGTAGIADEVVDFHTGGTYTITFCHDSNNDAGTSPTPCAGEAISATGTHTANATVDHVHVKQEGATDALCHAGGESTSAPEGSLVSLQGCAVAMFETSELPAPGANVIWILNPAGAPDSPGTLQGAQNTTDSQGQASAQVTSDNAAGGKSTTVRFCLDEYPEATTQGTPNGNGTCDAAEEDSDAEAKTQAEFRIDWTETGTPPDEQDRQCSASRETSGQNEVLIGTGGSDTICGFGGNDTIRGLGGNDVLKGGSGQDNHLGGAGDDNIRAGGGKDIVRGGSGDDNVRGQGGKDTLRGGSGDDNLKGQGGKDVVTGGGGNDRCGGETEKTCES